MLAGLERGACRLVMRGDSQHDCHSVNIGAVEHLPIVVEGHLRTILLGGGSGAFRARRAHSGQFYIGTGYDRGQMGPGRPPLGWIRANDAKSYLVRCHKKSSFVASRLGDLLVRRGRHPCLPGWIAEFEHITARVEEVQLAPGKETLLAINNLDDADALVAEELAGLFEHLRANRKGMMQAVIL